MWLSNINITGTLDLQRGPSNGGQLYLVDWTSTDSPKSQIGNLNASQNSALYLFSAQPRNGKPMLTVTGTATFLNSVLTLADLNKNGGAAPNIDKFEAKQLNKSNAAQPFKAGDVIIHFDHPELADASDYDCQIDDSTSGKGNVFTLMANRTTGDVYLSTVKAFQVTAGGTTKGFPSLAAVAGYIKTLVPASTSTDQLTIKMMTDYTMTADDRVHWEQDAAGYKGNITVTTDTTIDGTPRRIRIPNKEDVVLSTPRGVNKITFNNICFSLDTSKDFYANGSPMYFGQGTTARSNDPINKITVNIYGGSKGSGNDVQSSYIKVEDGATILGNIYGGGNGASVGQAIVSINGGMVGAVYGGGNGAAVTTSSGVYLTGGTVGKVYGGGNGTAVTNHTSVQWSTGAKAPIIYGGGSGTSKSDTTQVLMNKSSPADVVPTVYGGGDSAKSTVGTTATIESKGGTFNGLYDFDELKVEGSLQVEGEIDSSRNGTRKGMVNFSSGGKLTLDGISTPGNINRVGTLETYGGTSGGDLYLKRSADGQTPLVLDDQNVPLAIQGGPITLHYTADTAGQAASGDILLEFTNKSKASIEGLLNGITKVPAMSARTWDGTVRLGMAKLYNRLAVEYPGQVDTADGKDTTKNLVFSDEPGVVTNFKAGYVIGMPYAVAADPSQSVRYTQPVTGWDGTDATVPAGGYTITPPQPGGKNIGRVDGFIQKKDTLYFAHIMDQSGTVYSRAIDIQAPGLAKEPSVTYEDQKEMYKFAVTVKDASVAAANLPEDPQSPGNKVEYDPNGIVLASWAEGPATGNVEADKAAGTPNMDGPPGVLNHVTTIGGVIGVNEYTFEFEIPESSLKQFLAKDKTAVIWVYAKDGNNNTARLAIPISSNIMDVSVPVKVKMVALAQPGAVHPTPRLLAPVCSIVNQGETEVKAEIVSFTVPSSPGGQDSIRLVNKANGFGKDELSLKIAPPDNAANPFAPRNVTDDISPTNPLLLGTMKPGTGSGLSFTFKADFDPATIILAKNWTTGQLAYRFTVVKPGGS